MIRDAYQQFSATVNEADSKFMRRFAFQNFHQSDWTKPEAWNTAFAWCKAQFEKLEAMKPVVATPEPTQDEQITLNAPEQRKRDQADYIASLTDEIFSNSVWREAMQSLSDTSSLEMPIESQAALFKFMSPLPKYQPVMNFRNIRRVAIAFWGAQTVGLTPREAADRHESHIFESMDAETARKTLGIPKRNDYTDRMHAGIRQGNHG
jgi:hypothetical protein